MKKIAIPLVFLLTFLSALSSAQDLSRNREIMEKVMSSDKYSFATGTSDSLNTAISYAVSHLADQIMTDVKVSSKSEIKSQNESGELNETVIFEQVSETFTNVKLSDYQQLVIEKPNKKNKEYLVFVYISKDKINEIVKEIEENEKEIQMENVKKANEDVKFYYSEGCKAINDIRIGDALKYLYWSYVISLGTNISIEQNGKTEPATRLLETKIDNLLNNVQITPVSYEKEQINDFQEKYKVILNIEYNKDGIMQKVTNLDYEYNDGNTFQKGPRVRDGVGVVDLQYPDMNQIRIKCTYKYDQNETPPDIYETIKTKGQKKFSSAVKIIPITESFKECEPTVSYEQANTSNENDITENETTIETPTVKTHDHEEISKRINLVETAIRNKDYESVIDYFTPDGYDSFKKLVQYGHASIIGTPQYRFLDYGNLTLCRSITMQFKFRNNKQFIENITFRFNQDNLIESLAFTLSDVAERDILGKGKWERNSRLLLMTFLEDYQTAYALGRIDYLERIFSENALIITGNKVEKKVMADNVIITESVKYDTLSKTQYMERLKRHFRTKEYINLNFTDTDFKRASDGDEFYGIRVRQEYFSNTYGDVGYLFLLVDLRFEEPIIHIRAWQNDKLPLEALFGMSDVY
jgi:hypothetical protein